MFNWIKGILTNDPKPTTPKCYICSLTATYYMQIRFQRINFELVTGKILITICNGCYDDTYEKYNPQRIPSPVKKGVFENKEE